MDFTCELRQNGVAVASTTTSATFTIRGSVCTAQFKLAASDAGTVGTQISVAVTGLPAERITAYRNYCRGWMRYTRIGVNNLVVPIVYESGVLSPQDLGITPSFAIASTDIVSGLVKFVIA